MQKNVESDPMFVNCHPGSQRINQLSDVKYWERARGNKEAGIMPPIEFSLDLLQLALYSVLKQEDNSIPSQEPRNNTTCATGICLLQVGGKEE
ncbi:hypothetical protein P7K49_028710 [Saguinus oedipus]|uniref:Uncharacterized protein n=1 Tax=Saguinus oedipus TaxID=9490 RepID=A0ABQ9U741_SAGOE|nr:hypothetical protein P7K49_028710 [Saguinus oedipus]